MASHSKVVMARCSYGLDGNDSYCLCSYGLCSYGHGLYSHGPSTMVRQADFSGIYGHGRRSTLTQTYGRHSAAWRGAARRGTARHALVMHAGYDFSKTTNQNYGVEALGVWDVVMAYVVMACI